MNYRTGDGILILGGTGQLGMALRKLFPAAAYSTHNPRHRHFVSMGDSVKLSELIRAERPSLIINTAAMTDVDLCETDRTSAFVTNGRAVGEIVKLARELKTKLVHISTDYIFDGKKGFYSEFDPPNPINYYGFTKSIGDTFAQCYNNSLIIRTSGVYGFKRNFPYLVYSQLKRKQTLKVLSGYYSPIHATSLALAIKELMTMKIKGVVNVAGERVSRHDLALRIAVHFGLTEGDIEVGNNSTNLIAKRPFDSSLNINKAKSMLDFDFYSLESNLAYFSESIGNVK